jgi:uncharacterized protein YaeQ
MALTATVYHWQVALSDVDRGVYAALDLRLARHPSETMRYLLTRALAYCLCYEEGIAFSKGGLSSTDEPPLLVRDATGALRVWIEVGAPSAERLHKATKAAERVVLFTHADLGLLRREAATRPIHRLETIEVYLLAPAFLDALEPRLDRNSSWELVRSDGQLYVTAATGTVEGALARCSLSSDVP